MGGVCGDGGGTDRILVGSVARVTDASAKTTVEPAQLASVFLPSTITCPTCGHQSAETMPTDACQYIYECKQCGLQMKPKRGDCCVYCSYGDVPWPPIQQERSGCCTEDAGSA